MNLPSRAQFKALLTGFFASSGRDREVEAGRVFRIERDVILPVRGAALLALTYFFFAARWFDVASTPREEAVVRIIGMFVAYALIQITYAVVLFKWARPSPRFVEGGVFATGLLDGLTKQVAHVDVVAPPVENFPAGHELPEGEEEIDPAGQ